MPNIEVFKILNKLIEARLLFSTKNSVFHCLRVDKTSLPFLMCILGLGAKCRMSNLFRELLTLIFLERGFVVALLVGSELLISLV